MQIAKRLKNETAREYAFRALISNIVSLELEPGSMVSESELASELGLSRTPVREALIELNKSEIIEIYPQKGSRVSLIDDDLVEESRFMRLVLEMAMLELICGSNNFDISPLEENLKLQDFYLNEGNLKKILELDNEFHKLFFTICRKKNTYKLLQGMAPHFDRVRTLSITYERSLGIIGDHKKLFKALKNKNQSLVREILVFHLSRYKEDEIALKKEYPQYFK